MVNIVCAALLGGARDHAHGRAGDHDCGPDGDREGDHHAHHAHFHRDHNLRSAYLHVLADALTSVFAIAGLLAGRFLGWAFMDPVVGIAGAVMIARWSTGLLRDTGAVLLDQVPSETLTAGIRTRIERNGDEVVDLHVWRIGPGHAAAIVAVRTDRPRAPEDYRQQLADLPHLSHVTVEVTVRRGG
jgi:cation diffusion facilitator family transporter